MPDSTVSAKTDLNQFLEKIRDRHPGETAFHQTVQEAMAVLLPFIQDRNDYRGHALPERLTEPDRCLSFRITWLDDHGNTRVNRGYRVQFNDVLGPYKGGLRLHPTVSRSILKSLAFEQVLKNSLTGLPMGGAKGGADFNPKDKSEAELMRFCQAFMRKLYPHLGSDTDVPAGDIGVGQREIGYFYGAFRELRQADLGVITGKPLSFGGSALRREATGYGVVYFTVEMLRSIDDTLEGKKCLVSGSGNVAQHVAEKIIRLGGKVLTLSDSDGTIYLESGLNEAQLDWIKELKNERQGRIKAFTEAFDAVYLAQQKPWELPADIAIPCATENELSESDARNLVRKGCKMVVEGANMPVTPEAREVLLDAGLAFGPGKAANAGGVAVSGMEMSQNQMRLSWTAEEVDEKLREVMRRIHRACAEWGREEDGRINYPKGANIAAFTRVADAMIAQGVV